MRTYQIRRLGGDGDLGGLENWRSRVDGGDGDLGSLEKMKMLNQISVDVVSQREAEFRLFSF